MAIELRSVGSTSVTNSTFKRGTVDVVGVTQGSQILVSIAGETQLLELVPEGKIYDVTVKVTIIERE
jgi:hypothetical protein